MKAMGKVTLTLGLMIIVSLFLTSCSGVVTPELQLDLGEDINTVTPEIASGNLEETVIEDTEEAVIEDTEETGTVYPQQWATGEGTVENPWANDCIQKAYDFVSDGGTIFLKAGYYQLNGELYISKSINIVGEGINKTIVKTADADGFLVSADYVSIKDLTVDGDAQTDGQTYLSPISLRNYNGEYALLENIEVKNAGYYGLLIHEFNHSTFQNIYAHDNYRHGMHPGSNETGRNKYNTYRDIFAWNNGVNGFKDRGHETKQEQCYNIFDNLRCWGNGHDGIMIGGQLGGVLSNSFASDNGRHGIRLWEAEDFNIHDCFITLSEEEGIWVQNSDNINFTNIIIKNNNVSDTTNIGGIKIENSSGIKFTSCQSYDDRTPMLQEYGIRTVGDVDFVEIINCILTPNEKYAICNDAGAVITVITEKMLAKF